jgi:hypothetical protein
METLKHSFITNNIRLIYKLSLDNLEFCKQHGCHNLTPSLITSTLTTTLQVTTFNGTKVKTFISGNGGIIYETGIRIQCTYATAASQK